MTSPRVGRWTLDHVVGHGAMGRVWLARHDSGLRGAVKILRAETADERFRIAFREEVRAVAALSHPNVVTVHDHDDVREEEAARSGGALQPGTPWLAMEWASGGSLATRPLPASWADLRPLLATLLQALAHVHARGIVHRDLKPANLLVCTGDDRRPGPKVADFGIARTGSGASGLYAASPGYAAPEQLRGRSADEGPWTDLYAVGAIAWALACGIPPHAAGRFAPRFPVPRDLDAWLARLLARDPADRYRRAADAALGLLSLGEPTDRVAPREVTAALGSETWAYDERPVDAGEVAGPELEIELLPIVAPALPRERPSSVADPAGLLDATGRGLYAARTVPLVGRSAERDALWTALRDAIADRRPRAVVIAGVGGVGRSRLAVWLAETVAELGAADALKASFGADRASLVELLAREIGDTPRGVSSALPELGVEDVDAIVRAAAGSEPAVGPAKRALASLARRRPVVLVLDDAHESEDALTLARQLLRADEEAPLLAVVTVRTDGEAPGPAAAEALARLLREPRATRLDLAPLPPEDVHEIVRGRIGVADEVAWAVVEAAGGIPALASAIVAAWLEAGELAPGPRGYALREGAAPSLPSDLAAAWRARTEPVLAAATPGDRLALEVAAVLGAAVDGEEWRAAARVAGAEATDAVIEPLLAQGLACWTDRSRGSWVFAHAHVRAAVLAAPTSEDRLAPLHLACAAALSGRQDRTGAGLHLVRAGRPDLAVEVLIVDTKRVNDNREVDRYVREARAAIETLRGTPAYKALSRRLIAAEVASLHAAGRIREVVDRAEEALALVPATELAGAILREQVADCLRISGQPERALRVIEACAPDDRGAPEARRAHAAVLIDLGRLAEARAVLGDELPREPGFRSDHLRLRGVIARLQGRVDDADRELAAALDGVPAGTWRYLETLNQIADVARLRGDLDAASARYEEVIRWFRATGSGDLPVAQLNLSLVLVARGRFAEAEAVLERCARTFERQGRAPLAAAVDVVRLAGFADARDADAFDAHLARARRALDETGFVEEDVAWAATIAADVAGRNGLDAQAAAARDLAASQRARLSR